MTRTHKGIEIRAEIDGQPILESNSYTLHLFGKLGQYSTLQVQGFQFPQAPKGWGYLLGMPFAPCPTDQKSPVLSILYRAAEIDLSTYEDDEPAECVNESWHRAHRTVRPTHCPDCGEYGDDQQANELAGWIVQADEMSEESGLYLVHEAGCGYELQVSGARRLADLVAEAKAHVCGGCGCNRG